MTKIVAVSGGVDSVVLLDILSRGGDRLIVTHVDHGIRPESADDARFVEGLARQYKLPYVSTQLKLGPDASEEAARAGRYVFLYGQAREHGGAIMTAHHQDDMIGSIAINLARGTGWRGLAVMNRPGIERPLLGWSKQQIYKYALDNRLEWVEDATNHSAKFMRNRLRAGVVALDSETADQLIVLRSRQLQLGRDIDRELARVVDKYQDKRHPYIMIAQPVAIELLRYQWSLTRPAAERLLVGIKTARAHTRLEIGGGLTAEFGSKTYKVTSRPESKGDKINKTR